MRRRDGFGSGYAKDDGGRRDPRVSQHAPRVGRRPGERPAHLAGQARDSTRSTLALRSVRRSRALQAVVDDPDVGRGRRRAREQLVVHRGGDPRGDAVRPLRARRGSRARSRGSDNLRRLPLHAQRPRQRLPQHRRRRRRRRRPRRYSRWHPRRHPGRKTMRPRPRRRVQLRAGDMRRRRLGARPRGGGLALSSGRGGDGRGVRGHERNVQAPIAKGGAAGGRRLRLVHVGRVLPRGDAGWGGGWRRRARRRRHPAKVRHHRRRMAERGAGSAV
mmetsp:Transcript_3776/g.16564  ORF Transcript_3776/g.16564 Transcript_3776/m.16564 type:complete len:274 (-) Transcript_3776:4373-5194(-)